MRKIVPITALAISIFARSASADIIIYDSLHLRVQAACSSYSDPDDWYATSPSSHEYDAEAEDAYGYGLCSGEVDAGDSSITVLGGPMGASGAGGAEVAMQANFHMTSTRNFTLTMDSYDFDQESNDAIGNIDIELVDTTTNTTAGTYSVSLTSNAISGSVTIASGQLLTGHNYSLVTYFNNASVGDYLNYAAGLTTSCTLHTTAP